jgi:endonuclease/exonuclease/phosphatase family metal-dependent hydrolase
MRIASFNVENLFDRARAMNQETWAEGKVILDEFSKFNKLIAKETYTDPTKENIIDSLKALGLRNSDESKFVILRQNHGKLLKRTSAGPQVIAPGREDWIGWLELKKEAVNEIATQMTAKVIKEVDADILAVIEAEDRIALRHFNDQLLEPIESKYRGIMLIDGNDDRGIDVGLFTKPGFQVQTIVSHVDDATDGKTIFSRDCPEYLVRVSDTKEVLVLVNHFKSKGFGSPTESNARRKAQAKRVKEIYNLRKTQGVDFIAVVGDFNDTPASDPLKPLIQDTDLKDIFVHPQFDDGGRPGTFGTCSASNKIDYILLSPALFNRVTSGGVFRKGIFAGANGTIFPHFDEIKKPIHSASDHAAVFADFDMS